MIKAKFIIAALAACSIFILVTGCSKPGDRIVNEGMTSFREGDYDKTIEYLNAALESETNYSDAMIYTLLANTYVQKQDWNKAIEYHKKALEIHPNEYSSWILLGALSHHAENDQEAEAAYKKAIECEPKRPEAYGSLGALYLTQNKIDEAISYLEKSRELNPRLGVVQGDLAVAYATKGKEKEAMEALELAEKYKAEGLEAFKARVASALGKGPAMTSTPEAQ